MVKRWFGKKEEDDDEVRLPTLETMLVGDLVDYDLKTWEVVGYNTYDYDGDETREWELKCIDKVVFLERGREDGQVWWTLMRRIGLGEVEEDVAAQIHASEDPPETVHHNGVAYQAVETSTGLYRPGEGPEREFVSWSYEVKSGELLVVSQWGENDFAAYQGTYVEDYQFTDVLPGG